jgi:hypothetical protein
MPAQRGIISGGVKLNITLTNSILNKKRVVIQKFILNTELYLRVDND